MRWYLAFLDSIVRATWRRRWLAAFTVALFIITITPLFLGADESDSPVRYEISEEQSGAQLAVVQN